jgi:pimeloyl-ACP methyl ester carboxylesterase
MLFDNKVDDPCMSYQLAFMVSKLWFANADAEIRAMANVIKPGVATSFYVEADGMCTPQEYLFWPDLTVVLLGGTPDFRTGLHFVQGLNFHNRAENYGDCNITVFLEAGKIVDRIALYSRQSQVPIIFAGHSLGGAHGIVAALRFRETYGYNGVRSISYGSPRPGGPTLGRYLNAIPIQRWMNKLDPVPYVIPSPSEAAQPYLLLNDEEFYNAERYVQPKGGSVLDESGAITAADVPPDVAPDIGLSISAWLWSLIRNTRSEHQMTYYVPRLSFACDRLNSGTQRTLHTDFPGVADPQTPAVRREFILQQLEVLRQEVAAPGRSNVVLPEAEAFVPKKLGKIWVVQLRGETISLGPSRRRSRSFCSKANAFLRKLQIQGKVDTETFVAAFSSYLDDASDPQSAFRPTMNT